MRVPRTLLSIRNSLLFIAAGLTPLAGWSQSPPVAGDSTVNFTQVLGLTFVEARVNGSRPLEMVLDTGASSTILKPEVARELGLKGSGESMQTEGLGKGADETLHLVKGVTLDFAGQTLKDRTIATLPVDYIDREAGRRTDGLLGSDIFLNFVVHEDYPGRKVTLISPDKFVAPEGFTPVPLQVAGTVSLVQLQLQTPGGEKVEGTFLLDSGLVGNLFLMKPFIDAHPGLKGGNVIALPTIVAVGGDLRLSEGRLASLGVGPFAMADPVVVYQDVAAAGKGNAMLAGILGTGVLRRFDVIFDYPHGKLWLKPNAEFGKPFFATTTGMLLAVVPPEFHRVAVKAVIAGSPAAAAGVQAGDTIVAMSHTRLETSPAPGENAGPQILSEVSEWLREPGQNVYLRLERGGKTLVVHFVTKQLL